MPWVHGLQCSFSFSHQTHQWCCSHHVVADSSFFFVVRVFFLSAAASFPSLLSEAQGHGSAAAQVRAEPLSLPWGGWVGPCSCCPWDQSQSVQCWRGGTRAGGCAGGLALPPCDQGDHSHRHGASVPWWRLGLPPCSVLAAFHPCQERYLGNVWNCAVQATSRSIQEEQSCHQQCLSSGWDEAVALRQAVFIFVEETINSVIKYC